MSRRESDESLTMSQLIHQLQAFEPDTPVRLALRPDFPFTHRIGLIVDGRRDDGTLVVYIAQGDQEGYLPTAVRRALGWPPG